MNHCVGVAARVTDAAPALILVAAATAARAGAVALAVHAACRPAPEAATEADLQILAAPPQPSAPGQVRLAAR